MNHQPEIREPVEQKKNLSSERRISLVLLFTVILIIAIAVTALATFSYTIKKFCHVTDENSVKLQTITKLIEEKAYYDPAYDQMLDAALKAYVGAAGDKYTVYYNAEEFAALTSENQGNYVGIGVTVQEAEIEYLGRAVDVLEVVRVLDDSPAANGGLCVGDYVFAVESADGVLYVDEVGRDIVTNAIRGEIGTAVKIIWLTPDEQGYTLKEAEFTREEMFTISVEAYVSKSNPTVGVVAIHQFDLTTPTQLCSAFESLEGRGISQVVLDLRDNGGGDLLSVIACASYFLEENDAIISTKDKNGTVETQWALRRVYKDSYASCSVDTDEIGQYRYFDIVVLVNRNTASAAELLTAVLRDYELASVVGEQTFGKGSLQTLFSLEPYGIEGCLKVTTDLYYPPSGESYNGVGITPDISVESVEGFEIGAKNEQNDLPLLCAIEQFTK